MRIPIWFQLKGSIQIWSSLYKQSDTHIPCSNRCWYTKYTIKIIRHSYRWNVCNKKNIHRNQIFKQWLKPLNLHYFIINKLKKTVNLILSHNDRRRSPTKLNRESQNKFTKLCKKWETCRIKGSHRNKNLVTPITRILLG